MLLLCCGTFITVSLIQQSSTEELRRAESDSFPNEEHENIPFKELEMKYSLAIQSLARIGDGLEGLQIHEAFIRCVNDYIGLDHHIAM